MKFITQTLLSLVAASVLFSGAAIAGSPVRYGANPTAINDVHIVNHTLDAYTVTINGQPSGASYGSFTLGTYNPYNSMWIDFMYGDSSACVEIVRNADGKVDFSGCGLTRGSSIDVPVSATFKAQHPKA